MYLLTKYIKSVFWRVSVRLSYIYYAWCLKVNQHDMKACGGGGGGGGESPNKIFLKPFNIRVGGPPDILLFG